MTSPIQRQNISLTLIDIYGGTQTRVATSDDAIESYAAEMALGAEFPPITIFFDGSKHWLADGFHRLLAVKRNGETSIDANVQPGSRTDALRHALGANATNGLYRTNADKRNVADIALREWPDLSNSFIADVCKVSVELVRTVRTELTNSGMIEKPERVTGKDGKEYTVGVERKARGKTEKSSEEEAGGGGKGGGFSKGKADFGATGGTNKELEMEARSMIRKGEMNPFELSGLLTATAHDYAATVVALLDTMKPEIKDRTDGLIRIKRWVDKALADTGAQD